ncbi:twin-arginine translocation signal domain-containing protein [Nocardia cyriacigeorgica]|uniref:twin-arginine translocation signal domain-containing protein n=1 Tax=Nocardia cyriacigeorgica TaxID=135487 RepID=UPI002453BF90|nr:twin-arginine translocation signal domain-containing protein [Nocardia cyriacigeorgica]
MSSPPNLGMLRTRRNFLALSAGAGTAALLAACGNSTSPQRSPVGPDSEAVRSAEDTRRSATAAVREVSLRPAPSTVDLGGVPVQAGADDGAQPGRGIRVGRGRADPR